MTKATGILTLFLLLLLPARILFAEISLEDLVEDANLQAGPAAAKDFDGWRTPRKIVVRDGYGVVERLRSAFPQMEFVGVESEVEAAGAMRDADAIIGFCSKDILDRANRLVWIQIFSSGAEGCVSIPEVHAGDYLVTNMQKMASPVIGEHAIALMLAITRGLAPYAKSMQGGAWDVELASTQDITPVAGKTMLVAGLGGIGTAAAKRAAALGMRVIATRNSSRNGPDYVDYVGLSDELLELAAEADVVVNALPLTEETTDLFDGAFFDAVKPGAYFVNVARGGSVVTEDLMAALKDGRIRGAGLDVTDPEPLPPGHPLWQFDNVIITPHIAWYGNDRSLYPVLIEENVRRFIAGDALFNVVDPARGY